MPHPTEWIHRVVPRYGELLVRRAARGYHWQGLIQVPDQYRTGVKNANAIVHRVGEGFPDGMGIEVGDVVWITHGVARLMQFEPPPHDDSNWEWTLYSCRPGEVIMNLGSRAAEAIVAEERPGRYHRESEARLHAEDRADETA